MNEEYWVIIIWPTFEEAEVDSKHPTQTSASVRVVHLQALHDNQTIKYAIMKKIEEGVLEL